MGTENKDIGAELTNYITACIGWENQLKSMLKTNFQITLNEWYILLTLNDSGEMSVKELSDTLEINYSTIADSAATLEGKRYISKKRDGLDLRVIRLSITKEGTRFFAKSDNAILQLAVGMWGAFKRTERNSLLHAYCEILAPIGKIRMHEQTTVRGDTLAFIMFTEAATNIKRIMKSADIPCLSARLMVLAKTQNTIRPKDAASMLAVTPAEISKSIGVLEKAGYAERNNEKFKRETNVSLTARGLQKCKTLEDNLYEYFNSNLAASTISRETFIALTDKLAKALKDNQ